MVLSQDALYVPWPTKLESAAPALFVKNVVAKSGQFPLFLACEIKVHPPPTTLISQYTSAGSSPPAEIRYVPLVVKPSDRATAHDSYTLEREGSSVDATVGWLALFKERPS